jgi:hypothetical protein
LDITVILNCHREGLLANPSCSSLELAKAAAQRAGIAIEVLVILDRADEMTAEFIHDRAPGDWKLIWVNFGDLGRSRNEGVRLARGRWIAFLDADDLFSVNWLLLAFIAAENDKRLVVWHTEFDLYFGRDTGLYKNSDMDTDEVDIESLIGKNMWSALCFSSKDLLLTCQYQEMQRERQIGYEDWAWNQAVLGCGAIHKTVPNTCHFIRLKEVGSLNLEAGAARCIPLPSDYLVKILRQREKSISD